MPVVSVGRDKLFEALGKEYSEDDFQSLCFDYGIELDDVTTEKEMLRKEHHLQDGPAGGNEEVLYKIDIPANRYDMLCLEGIARALNIFLGRIPNVAYRCASPSGQAAVQVVVKPETALVRPFLVAAILRGVALDPTRYASFIDLQDKLHQNLCRQRSLVAIGTHDLATLRPPFTYEALPPQDISFVPLKQNRTFTAAELMEYYLANDQKLKKFVPIIKDSLVYPVIYDSQRMVLSLPPIINGAHSAISLSTKDIFIECTASDLTKAKIVLNTVCTMFSEYCSTPFCVEPVEVIDSFGESQVYPDLSSREMEVEVEAINRGVGVGLAPEQIAALLGKMQLKAELVRGGAAVRVLVPPTRSDVLHACDVMEDVAIAYGYNNIQKTVPQTVTLGREAPLNQLGELLRTECALAGYTEVLTWALVSHADNFERLRRQDDGKTAVSIGNPATAEFEICRTSLLSGALRTIGANKDAPLPLKLFELSDVVLLSPDSEVGSRNERRIVAVHCGKESGFEIVHGLLNRLMEVLGVPVKLTGNDPQDEVQKKLAASFGGHYSWKACDDATFFDGRHAKVYAKEKEVGQFGVIHPEVLQHYDISYPVSALELNIEPFCFDQFYKPLPTHIVVAS